MLLLAASLGVTEIINKAHGCVIFLKLKLEEIKRKL